MPGDLTAESNQQSDEWTACDEATLMRGKMQQSLGKVIASVFWYTQGIKFIDYLEKGKTITSDYYIALLMLMLERLKGKIAVKRII